MNISKVASRYAESLLEDAIEKGILNQVVEDMNFILKSIVESPQLQRFLSSPIIKTDIKKSALKEIFSDKISSYSLNFLGFVVDKNRENLLKNVIEKFIELKDDHLGIARLDVISAFPLSDDVKEMLLNKFNSIINKKVEANFLVDEKLLGGFVVKVKDTVYDASIKHQLEKLKQNLISGSLSLN
jgi:F-type H+-transporting ATPase subunit delta